jgi:hypothetical protein
MGSDSFPGTASGWWFFRLLCQASVHRVVLHWILSKAGDSWRWKNLCYKHANPDLNSALEEFNGCLDASRSLQKPLYNNRPGLHDCAAPYRLGQALEKTWLQRLKGISNNSLTPPAIYGCPELQRNEIMSSTPAREI